MIHSVGPRGAPGLVTILLALLATLSACGPYRHYQSAPLRDATDPDAAAASYRARTLNDPGLRAFVEAHGSSKVQVPVDSGWTPRDLSLAALYGRAELDEGRATLAGASAAGQVAGLRPELSASVDVERASRADEGKSTPWTVLFTAGMTFETGGKRGARLARAKAGILSAQLRLDAMGWAVAQEATQAAVALAGAELDVRDADAEAAALRSALELLRDRYTEGRISQADLALIETDERTAALAAVQARRSRTEVRGMLARTLALPPAVLASLVVRDDSTGTAACDVRDTANTNALQSLALRHRFDMGAVLADYTVAEGDVRVEIARQYPDLTLGPGIGWDQGIVRWVLSIGTLAIPRARNRGPIAEALARRQAQAARVHALQDSALVTLDAAMLGCDDARRELVATDSLRQASLRNLALVEAAYRRGEAGRTEIALATVAAVRTERAFHQAQQRRRLAGVALETAVGTWLSGARRQWPDLSAVSGTRVWEGSRP